MKNTLSSSVRSKALLLALAVVFALPAMAHAGDYTGKFTLTSETHWGSAVLAPGDYDFALESVSAPSRIVVRAANGRVAAIMISLWSSGTSREKTNSLQLDTYGGKKFVSAIYLPVADTELHFVVPSGKDNTVAREAPKTKPVTMTASVQ